MEAEREPFVAICAPGWVTGRHGHDEFDPVSARVMAYGRRSARRGVETVDVAGRGHWTFEFSTPQRLAAHLGGCAVYATAGADLIDQLPIGVGMMLDPADEHRIPILNRSAPPQALTAMRRRAEQKRTQYGVPTEEISVMQGEGAE